MFHLFGWDWDYYPSSDDDFEETLLQMFSDSDYSVSSDDESEATPVQMSNEPDDFPSSVNQTEATLVQSNKRQKKDEESGQFEETSVQSSKKQKKYDYLDYVVPQYSEEEFLEHFRLRRQVVEDISEKYRNSSYYNHQAGGNGKLIPLQQILTFLWFTGHETDTFRNVAERFNISASTLCLVVKRVTHFITSDLADVIKWPSVEEKVDIERYFRVNGLPGVVGAVGGTHIKIDKPQRDPSSYLNKKRFYSVQLQVVCDHKRRIRDICVGYPGSVDNETVFKKSPLSNDLEEMCGGLCVVGDKAYPCLKHLLTPYRDTEHLTRQQKDFNTVLSRNTRVVEHCFQLLKHRFRQLLHIKLRNMEDIVLFIQSCCILHNLAMEDTFDFEGNEAEQDDDDDPHEEVAHDLDIEDDPSGLENRDRIAAQLLIAEIVHSDNQGDKSELEKGDMVATQFVIPDEEATIDLNNQDDILELERRDTVVAQLLM